MLIAIVSDEYDRCVALSNGLYWIQLFDTATEHTLVFPPFPEKVIKFTIGKKSTEGILKNEMIDGSLAQERSRGRTLDISTRVNKNTDAKLMKMKTDLDERLSKMKT